MSRSGWNLGGNRRARMIPIFVPGVVSVEESSISAHDAGGEENAQTKKIMMDDDNLMATSELGRRSNLFCSHSSFLQFASLSLHRFLGSLYSRFPWVILGSN